MSLTISGIRAYWPGLDEIADRLISDKAAETASSLLTAPIAAACDSSVDDSEADALEVDSWEPEDAFQDAEADALEVDSWEPDDAFQDAEADGSEADANPGCLITWPPTLVQEMTSDDAINWEKSNWSNGDPFNCTWQPDNIVFRDGIMISVLDDVGCPVSCDDKPYASGEYRTRQEIYNFGYYEARMKPAAGDGIVSSFFVYTGTWGLASHHEIDFEFLGKDCTAAQINYYVEGRGGHERTIGLGFNACEEFHNYGFRWDEGSIGWYADGVEIHSVEEDPLTPTIDIPYQPTRIMVNFWPGIGVDAWLNPFTYPGYPIQAEYDWIKYSSLPDSP